MKLIDDYENEKRKMREHARRNTSKLLDETVKTDRPKAEKSDKKKEVEMGKSYQETRASRNEKSQLFQQEAMRIQLIKDLSDEDDAVIPTETPAVASEPQKHEVSNAGVNALDDKQVSDENTLHDSSTAQEEPYPEAGGQQEEHPGEVEKNTNNDSLEEDTSEGKAQDQGEEDKSFDEPPFERDSDESSTDVVFREFVALAPKVSEESSPFDFEVYVVDLPEGREEIPLITSSVAVEDIEILTGEDGRQQLHINGQVVPMSRDWFSCFISYYEETFEQETEEVDIKLVFKEDGSLDSVVEDEPTSTVISKHSIVALIEEGKPVEKRIVPIS